MIRVIELPKDTLNIAEIVERSRVCGPGERFVIWVQGCRLGCRGCWNKHMQQFEHRQLWTVDEMFERIIATEGSEGVTISGGEPLHQSRDLLKLVRRLKERNLTIMLYTGFEAEEIVKGDDNELVNAADIVVLGRYLEDCNSMDLKWRGSTNQEIVINNAKYRTWFESHKAEREMEIHVDNSGRMTILGCPENGMEKEVLH